MSAIEVRNRSYGRHELRVNAGTIDLDTYVEIIVEAARIKAPSLLGADAMSTSPALRTISSSAARRPQLRDRAIAVRQTTPRLPVAGRNAYLNSCCCQGWG